MELRLQASPVHMNGRVYDPDLGRFISADPYVQYPMSTQNYNRYTYVDNNPLSYTDPSGFHIFGDYYGDAYDNFTDSGAYNYDFNSSMGFFAGDSYSSLDYSATFGFEGDNIAVTGYEGGSSFTYYFDTASYQGAGVSQAVASTSTSYGSSINSLTGSTGSGFGSGGGAGGTVNSSTDGRTYEDVTEKRWKTLERGRKILRVEFDASGKAGQIIDSIFGTSKPSFLFAKGTPIYGDVELQQAYTVDVTRIYENGNLIGELEQSRILLDEYREIYHSNSWSRSEIRGTPTWFGPGDVERINLRRWQEHGLIRRWGDGSLVN